MLNTLSEYPRYRVPDGDQGILVDPEWADIDAGLREPIAINGGGPLEFCGKPLDAVRRSARHEVVQLAVEYTRGYHVGAQEWSGEDIDSRSIVMSGHQPELFHAGVWFKNFLLGRAAAGSGAIAINFLVDNDLCRSTSAKIPVRREDGAVATASVPFDAPRDHVPWELRSLNSQTIWDDFPRQIERQLLPLNGTPLLLDFWPVATDALRRHGRLGKALAEARHQLELQTGLDTLEVPLSHLVSTRAFARFSIQLLSELPRFQEVYNRQREKYRAAHRIRNKAHPVPALEERQGWIEAPWWVYRSESPARQRLWVRLQDAQLILSDRVGWQTTIEGRLDCDNASAQWLDLLADGICLRPRALLTTMYLRLFVADLFVHGIGGGKYDQLTNQILREFFGVEPPPMAVATATHQLPLENIQFASTESLQEQLEQQQAQLWQLRHHAEQMLEQDSEAVRLAAQKRQLLQAIPPRGQKWKWHHEITNVNRQLSQLTERHELVTKQTIANLTEQMRQQAICGSREFNFCLYPHDYLVPQLQQQAGLSR